MNKLFILFILSSIFLPLHLSAQKIALKTNTLYWITGSPNLGIEIRLNPHFTLDLYAAANPFSFNTVKLQFAQISPELRYWFSRPMSRHFIGINTSFTEYNLKFNKNLYKGNASAAGLTYGYSFVLSNRWNIEATLGIGCINYKTFDYKEGTSKPSTPNKTGTIFAPIKAGVSFAYILY